VPGRDVANIGGREIAVKLDGVNPWNSKNGIYAIFFQESD
jgi:hypothetical protein